MSHASGALRSLIETRAPRRPWSGIEKNGAHIRPLATALQEPYIQLNAPCMVSWLILDIDYKGAAEAWITAGLPPPTFVSINPGNGHAQMGYALSSPVCTSAKGREKPMRYLAAIEAAYIKAVRADSGFTGPLSKNPLHPDWKLWEPANAPEYELSVLAEYVSELPSRLPKKGEAAGLGRNCSLFDDLSTWAYRAVRKFWRPGGADAWREAVWSQAEALNAFPVPLPASEVKSVARSVARWVWRKFTPASFSARQAAVGRLKGRRKRDELMSEVREMHALGISNKAIAKKLGITAPTVANWLKR